MKDNVIVYGLGKYFEISCKNGKDIEEKYNIIGYCDKNRKFADIYKNYLEPLDISQYNYSYVIVTSWLYKEIVYDLIEKYHLDCEKILVWEEEKRKEDFFNKYGADFAYGQFGEDYVITNILKKRGIHTNCAKYIEIGVDDPFMRNHTYSLHLAGAKGILVDANPESINLIKVVRKGQKVLNRVVTNEIGKVLFYISDCSGLSSMSIENIKMNHGNIEKSLEVEAISVNEILDMQHGTDVLSIDCEGYDKIVLESIDFCRHQPQIICAEVGRPNRALIEYMMGKGYRLAFCNYINAIWEYEA